MQGSITPRTRINVRDNNGKLRKKLTVYDVQYRVTDPKTGKRVKKQKRGFLTKTEAEAFLTDMNTLDRKGILQTETKLTVGQYLMQWVKDYEKVGRLRRSTAENYQHIIDFYIIPRVGHIQLSKLRAADFEQLYSSLKSNGGKKSCGLADSTVEFIHQVFVEAIRHAYKHDLIPIDPTTKILKPPIKTQHEAQSYSVEEVRELLKLAHELKPEFELPIALAGLCGLRRGECLGIREEDIATDGLHVRRQIHASADGTLYVEAPKTKNSLRCVPLPEDVREMIQNRITQNKKNKELLGDAYHDEGWIVCNADGTMVHPNHFTSYFKRFLKRNGVRIIRFHELRHTCASLLLEAGETNLKVISDILGHSSIATTANIYTHTNNEQKQQAIVRLSNKILEKEAVHP